MYGIRVIRGAYSLNMRVLDFLTGAMLDKWGAYILNMQSYGPAVRKETMPMSASWRAGGLTYLGG